MRKEFGLFSIVCKNELESNFDKILNITDYGTVDEHSVAKLAIIWRASLNLTKQFLGNQNIFHDETSSAHKNLRLHFRNYVQAQGKYQKLNKFLKSAEFCGWVAQLSRIQKLNLDGELENQMLTLIETLSDLDAHMVRLTCEQCRRTYSSTLNGDQIKTIITDTPVQVFDKETCRSHVENTLNKTAYQISEPTLIQFFILIPFALFLYSLTFEIYPGLILSLFAMILLQEQFNNTLNNDSIIERASQHAIESRLYATEKPSEKIIENICESREQVSKTGNISATSLPSYIYATSVPGAPVLTKNSRTGIPEEISTGLEYV
jgi:hypothetical protein